MPTYHDGAFLFFRPQSTLEPMFPEAIDRLADDHGISRTVTPAYAGDRTAAGRALAAESVQLAKQGWLLRPILQHKAKFVFGIVKEEKNQAERRLTHSHQHCLEWDIEDSNGAHITGAHPLVPQIDQRYQELRGKVTATDWTSALMQYLVTECHAQAMRSDGRVYWVSPHTLPRIAQLATFLEVVGIDTLICEVAAEHKVIVQTATTESIAEQLQALQEEVAAFDGTQKPSTYKARIVAYQALRKRATLYRETLGIGVEQAETLLKELEDKVKGLLEIRSKTTIHRDKKAPKTGQPLEAAEVAEFDHTDPVAAVTGF